MVKKSDYTKEDIFADNEVIPLSYSGVADPHSVIRFRSLAKSQNPKRQDYYRQFKNDFYNVCAKKNQEMKAHGEMDKKEREKLGAIVNKKRFTVGRLQDNRQLLEQLQSK